MTIREKEIAKEYEGFLTVANELANKDVELYPLEEKELKRNRMERHLIGMMEMYHIRYGDADQRLRIVEFLEGQLFRVPPIEDETCHLTLDMWRDLRKAILSNEYQDLTKEAESA